MKQTFKITELSLDTNTDIFEYQYKLSKFPGGEIYVKIEEPDTKYYNDGILRPIYIKGGIQNSDQLMELLMLKNTLNIYLNKNTEFVLDLAYIPYARQDRVCQEGESLSIKVMADLINSMNFDTVFTVDNHSDVATALINNCSNLSVLEIFKSVSLNVNTDYIVSPDAGANKKVFEISKHYQVPMIRADKTRDLKTGNISGTEVYCEDLGGKSVTIIDDICDGGRTFIELAKALKAKNAGEITLYVTHGIFSKGTDILFDCGIDKIITTDSWDRVCYDNRMEVIEL